MKMAAGKRKTTAGICAKMIIINRGFCVGIVTGE
jgi:hypothetical protein